MLDELKKTFKSNCFIKLCENEFSYEIISTVFPEFKQIELFKKLNDYTKLNLHTLDFAFFLSLLILDDTDNSDYFFYKFNISKKNQKRIKLIKSFILAKNYLLNLRLKIFGKYFILMVKRD